MCLIPYNFEKILDSDCQIKCNKFPSFKLIWFYQLKKNIYRIFAEFVKKTRTVSYRFCTGTVPYRTWPYPYQGRGKVESSVIWPSTGTVRRQVRPKCCKLIWIFFKFSKKKIIIITEISIVIWFSWNIFTLKIHNLKIVLNLKFETKQKNKFQF